MVDIKVIEERLGKATPGPWLSKDDDAEIVEGIVATTVWENGVPVDAVIADCPRGDDANFIAHAPDDLRDLLTTVRELREALGAVLEMKEAGYDCVVYFDGAVTHALRCANHRLFAIDGECPVSRARRLLNG